MYRLKAFLVVVANRVRKEDVHETEYASTNVKDKMEQHKLVSFKICSMTLLEPGWNHHAEELMSWWP